MSDYNKRNPFSSSMGRLLVKCICFCVANWGGGCGISFSGLSETTLGVVSFGYSSGLGARRGSLVSGVRAFF